MPGELLRFESGLVTRDQLRSQRQAIGDAAPAEEPEAWVPSAARTQAKDALRPQWLQPSLAKLRGRAQSAYQEFLAR